MALEWCDDLTLGIDEIDRQHRAIFDHFNQLSLACHGGHGDAVVLNLLDFLEGHIHTHFETEERLMVQYGYPKRDTQIREHRQFAQDVGELRRKAESDGPSRMLAAQVAGNMVRWVVHHIRNHDTELVRYIRGCQDAD